MQPSEMARMVRRSWRRGAPPVAAWAAIVGLAACGNGRSGAPSPAGTDNVTSAVSADGAAALAYPEYDINVSTAWIGIDSRPASEIDTAMANGQFRLTSISSAAASSGISGLFSASLVLNQGPYQRDGNGWSADLSEADLLAIKADPHRRIVDIATFVNGTERRYAAVWVNNDGAQHFDYSLLLHLAPADFVAQAVAGLRIIDVETQPVPGCTGTGCAYEVSGVAIPNPSGGPTHRLQFFGYGPAAGAVTPPSTPTTPTPMSVALGVSSNHARAVDVSSPFGDGNFFWVAEEVTDPADFQVTCLGATPVSTERNWWFADERVEGSNDNPGVGQEDFLNHARVRFGGRTGKVKSYKQTATGNVRYCGVIYDNGPVPLQGTDSGDNAALKKLDAVVSYRLKRWGLPGGALALAKNGQLIYARGFGYSSLGSATDPPRLAQPTDMWRLASVSKVFAETLLLRLLTTDYDKKGLPRNPDGSKVFTGNTHPFGDLFTDYTPPSVGGACQVDSTNPLPDASGCTLHDIRIGDLIYHTTGLVQLADQQAGNLPNGIDQTALFSDDLQPPGANNHVIWADHEQYWRCITSPPPNGICTRFPFIKPPGVRAAYMNSEYQLVLEVIEKLLQRNGGTQTYQQYLAEVLSPLGLTRIAPAHLVVELDTGGNVQSVPYEEPMPFCYGGGITQKPPVADLVVELGPTDPTRHGYLGSASLAASVVDIVRFASALDGTRGEPRILDDPTFNNLFRSPGSIASATNIGNVLPFEHGGLFNLDTQALLRMDATINGNKITYAFAVNSDSLLCNTDQDFCCPGTNLCAPAANQLICGPGVTPVKVYRWTHTAPQDPRFLNDFDIELRNDIESIFNSGNSSNICDNALPSVDFFADYLTLEPKAVCKDATVNADATCHATISASQVDGGSTGGTPTVTPTTLSGSGTIPVQLTVTNGQGVSSCTAQVTVNDTTPPTITAPPTIDATTCDAAAINLGTPSFSDNCGTQQPTAAVISTNGVPLSPPRAITGGQVLLGPGKHVVRWTLSDGVQTATADQTVSVRSTIQAAGTFNVEDRAIVKQASGAFAAIFNSGAGATHLRYDAKTGGIVSTAPVDLLDRAQVTGDILSGGTISVPSTATVTGVETTAPGQVILGPLPTLPAFPAQVGGDVTPNPGTVTLTPGSRGAYILNSGVTLVLGSGSYFFRGLTVNNGAVIRATATTKIYARDTLAFRGAIRPPSGTTVQPVLLGYAGTTPTTMEAVFNGTLVAPHATVTFGTGSGLTFTGAFYAAGIDVQPASTLVCQTSNAVPSF